MKIIIETIYPTEVVCLSEPENGDKLVMLHLGQQIVNGQLNGYGPYTKLDTHHLRQLGYSALAFADLLDRLS